jgi:hypothetical protein
MKKLLIIFVALFLGINTIHAQEIEEDKTTTSERFVVPTTEPALLEARVFLKDLIEKTTQDIAKEEKEIALLVSAKAKLEANDPEYKEADREIQVMKDDIKNFKVLHDYYTKDLELVDQALLKYGK